MSLLVLLPWLLAGPAVESVAVPAPADESVVAPTPAVEASPAPAPELGPWVAPGSVGLPATTPGSADVPAASAPVIYGMPMPAPEAAAPRSGKFVYAWWAGLTLGISAIPSFTPATVFLGGRTRGPWAVGYQLGLSLGGAERYWGRGMLPLAHRHHVTGMRSFGRNRRGLVAVGGGAAFVWPLSPVVEAETRVAVRFGSGHWHLGGLIRLGWDVGHREYAPMPQFGLFIGTTNL
ncbi:hypothetical protein [Nannocystis radixulma]|uniref:Uncharacterized protein n=1 Tax=Nannocystis radixulma TaxID=2995305 RepID=A0ABT5B670_9BACT|nr:hypothetical protein [Nannocystis radixulma]MDC0669620.1 hypothetical protein [Nannocystis radixulma]